MEILITSKTRKGIAACIGGVVISNNRFVRLLNPGNRDQCADTDINVGDIWEMSLTDREHLEPPHIEDVIINSKKFVRKMANISNYIQNKGIKIYRGSPGSIFNGILRWTEKGSGYLEDKNDLPGNSVGFWISNKDLELIEKHYYYPGLFKLMPGKRLHYVGFEATVNIIPAGTLIRVSLARWWKPDDTYIAERCYLQLSGWY